jgi:DNA-binding NarL/FixJ family response regulator
MRVVLADDAVVLREGLARMLTGAGVEVCAQVTTAAELLTVVRESHPDVAIVDIRMPPTFTDEGLIAAAEIASRHPKVGVLLVSQYVDAGYAMRLLHTGHGRAGYLLKDRILDLDDFIAALERVAAGETVVDPALVAQLLQRARQDNPLDELTDRERTVLALMAQGLTDRGIADRLFITPKTVETHIRHLFTKLGLPTTAADNRRVHAVLTYLRASDDRARARGTQ